MKRPKRLIRISNAFIPVAMLIAALLGQPMNAARFYLCATVVSTLSLFSVRALPIAFAAQPSLRGVRGSAKCALLLQPLALAAALLIAWPLGLLNDASMIPFLCAGALYNTEHTFYEYLAAAGDDPGAALCQGISALLLLAGLVLTGGEGTPFRPHWIVGLSGLSALIGLVAALPTGFVKGRPNARPITSAPRATLQTLTYPALFMLTRLLPLREGMVAAFFCGLILLELCRTPFRRAPSESAPMLRALLITCAAIGIAAAVAAASPVVYNYALFNMTYACLAVLLAALCALLLYGNIPGRGREMT